MTSKKEQFFILKRKVSFKRNHHIVLNVLISPAIKENVDMRRGRMSLVSARGDCSKVNSGVRSRASGWGRGWCAHFGGGCPRYTPQQALRTQPGHTPKQNIGVEDACVHARHLPQHPTEIGAQTWNTPVSPSRPSPDIAEREIQSQRG